MDRALWEACRQRAADAGGGSAAQLVTERIASLSELEARHGPFDAIVVAAGAAVGALPELCAPSAYMTLSALFHTACSVLFLTFWRHFSCVSHPPYQPALLNVQFQPAAGSAFSSFARG